MKHCSLSAALHNPSTNVSDIESPSRNPEALLAIVGIVNGLVCLAIGVKDLYLWNPVLKKSKHLPSSNFSWKVFKYLGFGYNDSNDDYKVVKARCDRCLYPSGGDNGTKVEVYSLLTDSWRRIEDFKGEVPWGNGTYANGKIWWAVTRVSASGGNWKMVSLDMSSDKYEEVQGPVYEAGADNWEVTELGGRLYVLCQNLKIKGDLWVMDKFGVEESWSKVVSISYDDVHPAKPLDMNHVLCISRNGEIVLEDNMSGLLVYSSKDKEFRKVQLGGLRWFSQVFVYAESLVSPNTL